MVVATAEMPTGFTRNLVRSVLVVEDEEMIRSCVADFLRDSGFHVVEAGDVPEAKEILQDHPIDLVFSDINMPSVENGFALEKWVRRHFPLVKVLLTSGYPQASTDTEDLLQPMILKPYRYSSLLDRIEYSLHA
jgi:CheY-like chemotaxis protein